ncbi:hypothetical protein A0O34_00425 [Chryseobacterium glaciei]|uniref:Phage tail collar domain-containing protein n=1 Tax=Chryseobacterium glaciei TaxID=1685010 RepID=A0A172XQ82_9FLAO|nr:hypothetical protein [Chryseobacterium glaciei]ANF49111.1 hypothetical protein A0O34_00425 [Chryseobacterium glaciei]
MKKIYSLLSMPAILLILLITPKKINGQVGINTNNPTKTLDVNGEMRIRLLPLATTDTYSLTVADVDGNVSSATLVIPSYTFGDIKKGFQSTDHDGWYLLDGRAITTLPPNAQTAANTLSLVNLPDARGRLLKTKNGSEQLGALGGNNNIVLSRTNLPAYNFSGTTAPNGQHNHTVYELHQNTALNHLNFQYSPGCCQVYGYRQDARGTSGVGNHTHTFTASSEGSAASFSIIPQHITVNTFIYLGN